MNSTGLASGVLKDNLLCTLGAFKGVRLYVVCGCSVKFTSLVVLMVFFSGVSEMTMLGGVGTAGLTHGAVVAPEEQVGVWVSEVQTWAGVSVEERRDGRGLGRGSGEERRGDRREEKEGAGGQREGCGGWFAAITLTSVVGSVC